MLDHLNVNIVPSGLHWQKTRWNVIRLRSWDCGSGQAENRLWLYSRLMILIPNLLLRQRSSWGNFSWVDRKHRNKETFWRFARKGGQHIGSVVKFDLGEICECWLLTRRSKADIINVKFICVWTGLWLSVCQLAGLDKSWNDWTMFIVQCIVEIGLFIRIVDLDNLFCWVWVQTNRFNVLKHNLEWACCHFSVFVIVFDLG